VPEHEYEYEYEEVPEHEHEWASPRLLRNAADFEPS